MDVDASEGHQHDHANARQLAVLLEELCRLSPVIEPPTFVNDRPELPARPATVPAGGKDRSLKR